MMEARASFPWGAALGGILLLAMAQAAMALGGISPALEGRLLDPDCYMRLLRVLDWRAGAAWHDQISRHTNAPFGEMLPWTRPLDVLLYIGAWALTPFVGFERGLFFWGVFISPAFEGLAFFALAWGTRSYIPPRALIPAAMLIVLLPTLGLVFNLGRPDHHGLILLLFIAGLAALLQMAAEEKPQKRLRCAALAGIANGLGLWVSVESLLAVLMALSFLGLIWALHNEDGLALLRRYLAAILAISVIAVLIEIPPAEWTTPHYMRLSIAHPLLFSLSWGAVTALDFSPQKMRQNILARLLSGLLAAGAAAGVMAFVLPDFFRGPFAELMPDALIPAWLNHIAEFQPLWPKGYVGWANFLFQLGAIIPVLPYALWRLAKAERAEARMLTLILVGLAIYFPMALYQGRWAAYAQALFVLPWCRLLVELFSRPRQARALLALLIIVGHFLAALVVWSLRGKEQPASSIDPCSWQQIAPALSAHYRAADQNTQGILLTYIHPGPEIAWRTPYAVVGSPYGNASAILDTLAFFSTKTDDEATAILVKRNVSAILICSANPEGHRFQTAPEDNLHKRLARGELPLWLGAASLASEAAKPFRLFDVKREALTSGPRGP